MSDESFRPTVVAMPEAKNEAQTAGDSIRRQLSAILENASLLAAIRCANYEAYLKVGFNEAQALDLCAK